MYCNVYVPQLQHAGGLLGYVQRQLGLPVASTAPLAEITDGFAREMHRFAATRAIPWVDFVRGQRKDDVMHEHLAVFTAEEGVVFIGRAQEKTKLFRTEKRRDAQGKSYPWIVASAGVVNQFYVYCVDADFGPFFIKFCSYFPYNAKLCINGNHWAQRQAAKARIAFAALDNGFAVVDDPAALQAICDRLGPEQIDALLRKWLAILPHPFTAADRAAGYRYDISILQAEFSLTQMLDRPVSGRVFFEHVIRDNLDAGRPDQVSLVFDRRLMRRGPRSTPGRFRTRVITDGVTPSLHVDYKHATIKQYHKEGKALDRDHHQRHPRLPDRQTADQPARPAGGRLLCQPAPAAPPTTQPRPDHRSRRARRRYRTCPHRRRHPHPRPTPGLCAQPRFAHRTADLPATAPRLHQPPATRPRRPTTCTPRPQRRADELRPTPTAQPRPHRAPAPNSSISRHRSRTAHRDVPHPSTRPRTAHRTRTPRDHRDTRQAAPRRHRLPARHRRPHPAGRTRSLTQKTET